MGSPIVCGDEMLYALRNSIGQFTSITEASYWVNDVVIQGRQIVSTVYIFNNCLPLC